MKKCHYCQLGKTTHVDCAPASVYASFKNVSKAHPHLKTFRASLGKLANEYSDAQLEQLDREINTLAELLLHLYSSSKFDDQKVMAIIESKGRKHTIQH
jgi:flagellin-like hook-associated protein FlgL